MRLNRLDLNQLGCLDALLTHRNVSRAAQQVHLSQPAVSAALGRLREYFGDPLLVQAGRGYNLTPFAAALVQPVRDVLLQAQALTRMRPEADPRHLQRDITIVASDYVFCVAISELLRRAETEAPGLRFEVKPIWGYLAEELDHGDVDVVVSSATALSKTHPSEPLFADTFSCVAWEGNADIGPSLDRETFERLGHVSVVLGGGSVTTRDQATLNALGIQRRVEVRVPSFTLLPYCLVGTRRIGMLHTGLAHHLAQHWPLRVMPCPVPIPSIDMAVQWHRYQTDDPGIRWVRGTLQGLVRDGHLRPLGGADGADPARVEGR